MYNCEMTIDRVKDVGRRSYAANAYYDSNVDQPNLTIFTATQVIGIHLEWTVPNTVTDARNQATKINFEHVLGSLRAISVNAVAINSTGVTGTLVARKEVILAAGKPCLLL